MRLSLWSLHRRTGIGHVLSHAVRQRHAWSQTEPHQWVYVFKYVDWNSFATMLAIKRSASVTPEVNLRNPFHTGKEVCKYGDQLRLWNSGQTSPKVQNRGISGPTKKTMSSKFFFIKNVPKALNEYDQMLLKVSPQDTKLLIGLINWSLNSDPTLILAVLYLRDGSLLFCIFCPPGKDG